MAMLLQGASNKPGATTLTLLDGLGGATGYRLIGEPDWGNDVWDILYSGPRGTQGARAVGGTVQNRIVAFSVRISGSNKDDLFAKASALASLIDEWRRFGGTLTWRSSNQTYKQNFIVLSGVVALNPWQARSESSNIAEFSVSFQAEPYLHGDPLDFTDDFSIDTEADYAVDAGSGADILVTGGALTVTANPTTEKRLVHTAHGYSYGDVQVTLKPTPGSTISSFLAGVVLKWIDSSNYLRVYVDDNGTNSRLRIDKVVAGVTTNLATTNLAARVVNGTPFWVRGRIEGINVFAEHFTAAPSPMAAPTTSTSYTLLTAEQTTFGTSIFGKVGIDWFPQQSAATLDDFDVQAYVYRNATLPDNLALRGPVYGDVPSLADVEITPSGGAAVPIWASIGWWIRPGVWNRCWNGDFELLGSLGWSVAAVTNMNSGAATSVTKTSTAAKYGGGSGQIVAPASADRGAWFRSFYRFRKGVTYTAEAWIHSAAGVTNTYIRFGNAAANDKASSGNTALSTAWQRITVTWTPTADYDDAHVAINIAAATGTTFEIDGVMIYEGTVAPTSANQSEGRGGFPPRGIIEAENDAQQALSASANYRSGFGIDPSATPSGVVIDPALLVPDDYAPATITIEVWARMEISAGAAQTMTVRAVPVSTLSGAPATYTEEFGTVAKTLVAPSSGTVRRMTRLGTLRLRMLGRYKLVTSGSAGLVLDYLLLLPATARALSPSGKAGDSSFPAFVGATTEITRTIQADLSGLHTTQGQPPAAGPGLGGSLIELPVADREALVKLSSLVPDDPTSDTTTEQLAHSATVHFKVMPRWRLGRSS